MPKKILVIEIFLFLFCACSNSDFVGTSNASSTDEQTTEITPSDTLTKFPPSGFFSKPFTIVLPDTSSILCETGGKASTPSSPSLKIFQLDTSTTIRCSEHLKESNLTTEIIRTYIFEKKPTIPAIFITTDPNSLFDPDSGIYVEGPNAKEERPHYGANYWQDKEIPIFIELIETSDTTPAFAKYAGLKIFGNYSRMQRKKSVSITFREKYGDNRLNYKLFPNFPKLTTFKSFVLRNNGNNFTNDYIRDRLASSISEGLGVDYQRGRFVLVYYNSQYFGIHDMRERSNEYYFENHYGIEHNQINLLKADNSASAGTPDVYISLINWIKEHSLDNDENYAYISSQIDINNLINYLHIELFANNRDWPGNNLKKWNRRDKKVPWKWFLYDLDESFGTESNNDPSNVFEFIFSGKKNIWQNSPSYTFLFRSLLKNKEFKAAFINRMQALLQMNLSSTKIQSQIEQMMEEIKAEVPRDQKHWSLNASKMDEQLKIINKFATTRPEIITENLRDFFMLGESVSVTLSTNGPGKILIHGLPITSRAITIDFFKDFPVTISAEPQSGGVWLNWSDGEKNSARTIYPKKEIELRAFFK